MKSDGGIIGFKKGDIIFDRNGDRFVSRTRHPKIINGRIVCPEKRKLAFETVSFGIRNGYIPIYKKESKMKYQKPKVKRPKK